MCMCLVALVRTDVSEELSAPFIRVTRIGKLALFLAHRFVTLMKEALSSSETSVLTKATWRNIPEVTILHSHRRENLKSYNMCMRLVYSATYLRTFTCLSRYLNLNLVTCCNEIIICTIFTFLCK
jgi:hypothetical protein